MNLKVVHKTLLIFDCVQTCPALTYVCSSKHPCFWNNPFSDTSTNTFTLTCRREMYKPRDNVIHKKQNRLTAVQIGADFRAEHIAQCHF